jgi:high-affinity Fe2+/Pb2+ permease
MSIALLTLTLMGTLALAGTMALGYLVPGPGAVRQHFLAALGTTFLLVMGHSFIMFFLIATGVAMKEIEKEHGWGQGFRKRLVEMKSRVFPLMTGALLMVIANFIVGAGAHTRALPGWVHAGLAWATLITCVVTLHREYRVLGENNRLIEEAGIRAGRLPSQEDTARVRNS